MATVQIATPAFATELLESRRVPAGIPDLAFAAGSRVSRRSFECPGFCAIGDNSPPRPHVPAETPRNTGQEHRTDWIRTVPVKDDSNSLPLRILS